jgi:hypothetical protein
MWTPIAGQLFGVLMKFCSTTIMTEAAFNKLFRPGSLFGADNNS